MFFLPLASVNSAAEFSYSVFFVSVCFQFLGVYLGVGLSVYLSHSSCTIMGLRVSPRCPPHMVPSALAISVVAVRGERQLVLVFIWITSWQRLCLSVCPLS